MKKTISLLLTLILVLGLIPAAAFAADAKPVVIICTNDVHCGIDQSKKDDGTITQLGYPAVAGYAAEMKAEYGEDHVTLVDVGDAIQGAAVGTLSKGSYPQQLMNAAGYDLAIPGNHEFDYGMDTFLSLVKSAECQYISCNFMKDGKPVLDPYAVVDYGDCKVGFVGITTPETFSKSTPTYFQDGKGNYIYSFCETGEALCEAVQAAVDAVKAEGVDYVVALGHLGQEGTTEAWRSDTVISHTTGIDAFLDGHSHEQYSTTVANKDGKDVPLLQTGTKLASIGKLVIDPENGISTELVTGYDKEDKATADKLAAIKAELEGVLKKKVATTDVALTIKNPDTGERAIRNAETNMGNLCSDAYRNVMGGDIGLTNGGGIRADIDAGDVTYEQIINVQPYGNAMCLIEATGQQILDALEMGSRKYPEECGGFLQPSGLTYSIDPSVKSTVVCDDKDMFVKVEGARRVYDVKVGDAPIDPAKTYKVASHDYMLKNAGDGYTMFQGNKILLDQIMLDNECLITYITEKLGGKIGADYATPTGQGRITIAEQEGAPAAPTAPAGEIAYASTQSVDVDGEAVEFQMYALKDVNGNPTNYVKARDVASVLNGTDAQFEVGYDNVAKVVDLIAGQAYTANGSEMKTPFSGDRAYTVPTTATNVNGTPSELKAILLTSDSGGGFTYYKLRDLGKALGFNVSWSKERGVFIETDKPYEG